MAFVCASIPTKHAVNTNITTAQALKKASTFPMEAPMSSPGRYWWVFLFCLSSNGDPLSFICRRRQKQFTGVELSTIEWKFRVTFNGCVPQGSESASVLTRTTSSLRKMPLVSLSLVRPDPVSLSVMFALPCLGATFRKSNTIWSELVVLLYVTRLISKLIKLLFGMREEKSCKS